MARTGADDLQWLIEYVVNVMWSSESPCVIAETLEDAGAPPMVVARVLEMQETD